MAKDTRIKLILRYFVGSEYEGANYYTPFWYSSAEAAYCDILELCAKARKKMNGFLNFAGKSLIETIFKTVSLKL